MNSYAPQTWVTGVPPALSATSMNHIEAGIAAIDPITIGAPSVFNVKGYGATGNGTTNDTTSIQAAVTAAITAGGGIIWFPSGTYLINSTIQVYSASNIVFQGQGTLTNGVSGAPMVRFRNCSFCGTAPTLQWIGNWVSSSIGIELDGSLYGDFAIRGDTWPTAMNVITSASATQNSANNDLSVDVANGVTGMLFQGDGTHFASNNRISRFTWGGAGSGNPIGINFAKYCDTNIFRWVSIGLNTATSIAVIYNSATPASDMQVYENHFDFLTVQSNAAGSTDVKANRTTGTAARTSFIHLRRAGSNLTTASIATNADIHFVNTNDGTNPYVGKLDLSGSGAPTMAAQLGDRYWRTDTPGTTNQRLYICTTAGAVGTVAWTGIL